MWYTMEDFSKHLDHLSGDATDDLEFSAIGPPSLIVHTFLWDKPFIELRPFTIELYGMGHAEKKHLFHGSGAAMRQMHLIERRSRDFAHRTPTKVGFDLGGSLKVPDRPNRSHDGCSLNNANASNGGENLSLAGVLNNLADLRIQLLDMFLQEPQFSNELVL